MTHEAKSGRLLHGGVPVTRQEVADALCAVSVSPLSLEQAVANGRAIDEAAAALRQSCATCDHFNPEGLTPAYCYAPDHWVRVPDDGTGFCWLWTAKAGE